MRLKAIKLSGFKSFVDPTVIPVSANLIGIVGPNGCGKSNIIDAIRWVMGEMSAKHLRGDSMADVIFNGSNTRKPVAQASVELLFDNSDGGAGGQYAAFGEISIRREAGRDGQSDYYLNKTKCRRKDITDIFLGTGLGPRAYSIIEQGMVTRIIEAKPEELRGFIEEAAGISRYKERRRETENRIRHTRENLARVDDIRRELETQLDKLQRQSKAAARYKELRQEERLVKAQLLALRWRELDEKLQSHDREIAARQNEVDAVLAQQRAIEAEIERLRAQLVEANDAFNTVQGEFYGVGNEITRIEQAMEHARETRAQQKREQEQLDAAYADATQHLDADRARLDELTRALDALGPTLGERTQARDAAVNARVDAERALAEWQTQWDLFNSQAADSRRAHEIESNRVGQIEEQIARLTTRRTRLQDEARQIEERRAELPVKRLRDEAAELDEMGRTQEQEIATLEAQLRDARARREELTNALDTQRSEASAAEARLLSLQELQAHAERRDDAALHGWLERRRLTEAPRLSDRLRVETGWEKAVERVLGADLVALCVNGVDPVSEQLPERTGVTLFDLNAGTAPRASGARPGLLSKIATDLDLAPLLDGIFIAESLSDALVMRSTLAAHESIVTRDGDRVGCNWLRLGMVSGETMGLLSRRQEIEQLQGQIESMRRRLSQDQFQLGQITDDVGEMERRREDGGRRLNELHRSRAETRERLGHHEAQLVQIDERAGAVGREMAEVDEQMRADHSGLEAARSVAARAGADLPSFEQRRAELSAKREALQAGLDGARTAETESREGLHRLEIERESRHTEMTATRASIERLESQLSALTTRRAELQQLLADDRRPEVEFKQKLDVLLQQRLAVEERLSKARQVVTDIDSSIREQDQTRLQIERDSKSVRERLESERVARESFVVRRDTLNEQLREVGSALEEVVQELPEDATEIAWAERLEKVTARIERLGPINLVAIEEFDEANTRKTYLDRQHEDLSQALTTLEEAIRKMDRETKTRFKETYDKVNEGFQRFFPQLFGGGSAYLDLTDADLLETGVSVMARPPGKRNSTIHLLSGGEKALTAVALLFSIFELNPAPFCLLDEVDAPLDDVNVQRYAGCLKAMADRTQLMYITHNKISMEMADILLGVTMSEPGVSRLVAVDVEEALAMVAK
jgi:chromosome segregation protein